MADLTVTYTVGISITRPVRPDHDSTPEETIEWMVSRDATRELEREVLRVLTRIDGDCDVEVLEVKRDA